MAHKILLSAFACHPTIGSECYVGWKWCHLDVVNQAFEIHVLTRRHHKLDIEALEITPNVKFHYFELPFSVKLDHRHSLMKMYYILWQFLVVPYVLLLHLRNNFSIIQQLTYNSIDMPGFLWIIPFTKFVWGPVGGGQIPPLELKEVYFDNWKKQKFRTFLKKTVYYNPLIRFAAMRASVILYANKETANRLAFVKRKLRYCLETGYDLEESVFVKNKSSKLVLSWVGVIDYRKALIILLKALTLIKNQVRGKLELNVVGGGVLLEKMKRYSADNHLDFVIFHDSQPLAEARRIIAMSNLHVFTSVQDTSGNVVLESMSAKVPILHINHQGVKEMLKYGGGIPIAVGEMEFVVSEFAKLLLKFTDTDNKEVLSKIGEDAYQTLESHFTWDAKAEQIKQLYNEILA